jgi:predicted enzyme related to lactoylglutathione lyase
MNKPNFQMSTNIALHSKKWKGSSEFYKDVMGLDVQENETHLAVQNGPIFMYVQENSGLDCVVMEYFVEDVEDARIYLEKNGCKIVKWEGKGKDCYMRDPYGLTFNLWEK